MTIFCSWMEYEVSLQTRKTSLQTLLQTRKTILQTRLTYLQTYSFMQTFCYGLFTKTICLSRLFAKTISLQMDCFQGLPFPLSLSPSEPPIVQAFAVTEPSAPTTTDLEMGNLSTNKTSITSRREQRMAELDAMKDRISEDEYYAKRAEILSDV